MPSFKIPIYEDCTNEYDIINKLENLARNQHKLKPVNNSSDNIKITRSDVTDFIEKAKNMQA